MTDGPESRPSEGSHLGSKRGLNFSFTLWSWGEQWPLGSYVHQESVDVTLFGKMVFVDEIRYLEIRRPSFSGIETKVTRCGL